MSAPKCIIFNDGKTDWQVCDFTYDDVFITYYCVNVLIPAIQKPFTGEAILEYLNTN